MEGGDLQSSFGMAQPPFHSQPIPITFTNRFFFFFFPQRPNSALRLLLHTQQHQLADSSSSSSSSKRPRLDSQIQTFLPTNNVAVSPAAPVLKHSTRRSGQKLSDRTRSLQKLLPSDKKMDIATMLEEAYKYVRFLQAQVRAIESMPLDSSFVVQNDCDWACFGGGSGLGMLNRQQLLQVLVNSPGAQTTLYSQGFCVYSLEQLIFINKLSQPKLFIKN
ncbi:hypothetical protein LWI28_005735 [Acer negundo]|uniref:BHLH domain-containing protein n=1 Tax=Acer negundo TaxID=4023 RepID=A0AAD5IYS1_ACENE|nr:hypothetical protein LWI28_005735 [Acer negundo]